MQKIALLSVYHKDGIVEFARSLVEMNWHVLASGGTAKALESGGVPVTDVATITGMPAVLGHRVVTLAEQIHGGLMATEEMRDELTALGWPYIDLVCVDLYPLNDAIDKGGDMEEVIDKTDIGGPTMIRSAAKGRRIVIADKADRHRVIHALKSSKGVGFDSSLRAELCGKAEGMVAQYCLDSARFLSGGIEEGITGRRIAVCKYGENAWQKPAALYSTGSDDPLALSRFKHIAGSEPSYNNWCDVDRILQTMTHIAAAFSKNGGKVPHIALGAKHGNVCGAGVSNHPNEALKKMLAGDPLSIFGGVVMTNFCIGETEAIKIATTESHSRRLIDMVIAPYISKDAIDTLARKEGRCKMLENNALIEHAALLDEMPRLRYVRGGFLTQPNYTHVIDTKSLLSNVAVYSGGVNYNDVQLAWAIGSTSNSNTICIVKNGMLLGNGVGQQDRVGAAHLALERAKRSGHDLKEATAYSDSFFPFPDGLETLAEGGVKTVLASGGSVNDERVKAAAMKAGITLLLVPDSEARGFFGH